MKIYEISQNFKEVVSTKNTLIGADTSKFTVKFAPVGDLANVTVVDSQLSEVVKDIAEGEEHTAKTSKDALYGDTILYVESGHNVVDGDVIEYATGKYVYVTKAMDTKLYLRTKILDNVASGTDLVQKGNTGVYETGDIAIADEGEYILTVEAPEYGICTEDRIRVVDNTVKQVIDPDAPVYSEIAVAY